MELFGIEEPSPEPYISQRAVELLLMMLKNPSWQRHWAVRCSGCQYRG